MGKLLLVITDYYMVVALDCISFLSNYIVRLILQSYGYSKVAAPLDLERCCRKLYCKTYLGKLFLRIIDFYNVAR